MSTRSNLKKHCSGKNTAYFTLFIFYLFSFQTVLWAQDTTVENSNKKIDSASEFTITSTSTDEEISEKVAFYSNEYGLTLNVKKIIRTANGEISGIKMVFSNAKGAKQAYNVSDAEPIEPIRIFAKTNENNQIIFGFGDPEAELDAEDEVESNNNAAAAGGGERSADAKSNTVAPQITSHADEKSINQSNPIIDYEKAYILLDGKEISALEMELLDPATIGSTTKLNNVNNDNLVAQYGEKARYGVVLIESSITLQELTSDQINRLPENFKLDAYNGAFIIHKNTQNSDLKFYEKHLSRIGVTLEVSELERNASGYISNIKIKLHDDLKKVIMADWLIYKNANGIISIVVGRKNGKVSVYTQ